MDGQAGMEIPGSHQLALDAHSGPWNPERNKTEDTTPRSRNRDSVAGSTLKLSLTHLLPTKVGGLCTSMI